MKVKFCRDCKWSFTNENDHIIKCSHDLVNMHDEWALTSIDRWKGSNCREERSKSWIKFPKCGKVGKLWEPKERNSDGKPLPPAGVVK